MFWKVHDPNFQILVIADVDFRGFCSENSLIWQKICEFAWYGNRCNLVTARPFFRFLSFKAVKTWSVYILVIIFVAFQEQKQHFQSKICIFESIIIIIMFFLVGVFQRFLRPGQYEIFCDLLPTLRACNFFSTEPILKFSDVF